MEEVPRLIGSRRCFEGRVFGVRVDELRFADGSEHRVDVVEHGASVAIVATPAPDTIVLVRQYRHPANAALWEIPGRYGGALAKARRMGRGASCARRRATSPDACGRSDPSGRRPASARRSCTSFTRTSSPPARRRPRKTSESKCARARVRRHGAWSLRERSMQKPCWPCFGCRAAKVNLEGNSVDRYCTRDFCIVAVATDAAGIDLGGTWWKYRATLKPC